MTKTKEKNEGKVCQDGKFQNSNIQQLVTYDKHVKDYREQQKGKFDKIETYKKISQINYMWCKIRPKCIKELDLAMSNWIPTKIT